MAVRLVRLKKEQRKLKQPPVAGDIFRLLLDDGRWFLGRVILAGMPIAPRGTNEDLLLIYLFRTPYDGDRIVPQRLPISELLCVPGLVGDGIWQDGYFEHMEHRDFKEGERLQRHCLRYLRDDVFYDETGAQVERAFGPVSEYGVTSEAGIEHCLAEALGEQVWDQHLIDRRPEATPVLPPGTVVPVAEDSVVLFIPVRNVEVPRGLDEIEDPLIEAVESRGVGEWEGHGFDADLREWDIRFVGRSPKKVADAILQALKSIELPPGSFMIVGGKRPKRIDL